ncbi:N-acetylgalactosamine-6-sulfatase-like [Strongylocentrotus purpuratus]|uniref:Sulfatase N-terminal domain-containing protein n=1 Tax=Strongylocentrotus purpuratus TaxID=7668 RepID=A0A7M7N5X1_STRPU|nr:N-acetylgalactosamine-6-sulfatase-like [Strongylocentrotus purpuratus]
MIGRYFEQFIIEKNGESNLTQLYIKEGLNFIEKSAEAKQPFFLYWTPDATHEPVYASKPFLGRSQRGLYGDAVIELDEGVGQILGKLKELQIDTNTFVVFTSDNGAATYAKENGGTNGPYLCGKRTTYEGGMRVPTIAWWPTHIKPGRVTHQIGNIMDLFTTALNLAHIRPPSDRFIDGQSLLPALLNGEEDVNRTMFYYRGNQMMAVRLGEYKAHYWTWTDPLSQVLLGSDVCPGQDVTGVMTHDQVNHTLSPLLFHLGRDPGEKYPIKNTTAEYKAVMPKIGQVVADHKTYLIPGTPQLNMCDDAIKNWSPPGCEKLNMCQEAPPSYPYKCIWPF